VKMEVYLVLVYSRVKMRVKYHRRWCGGVAEVRSSGLRSRRTWVRSPAGITCSTGVIVGVVVVVVGMMRMMEVSDRCCWRLVTAP
jgi:hypothetical protein